MLKTNAKELLKMQGNLGFSIKKFLKIVPSLPNAHLTWTSKEYDLIHCAHCLSLNKKPWIADIEYIGQFWISGSILNSKKRGVKKILESKYCKKILAWTEWTKKGILDFFPEIKHKIEVVYPAIPALKFKKIKHKGIKLLFVSRFFYTKGGLHALEAIDRLTKKYENVKAIIISRTPKEIINKYSENKKIRFFDLVSQDKLFKEIYPKTDILIYPAYIDSFGFALTEALSFGIPIITINGNSRKEIVENGKTGFVLTCPKNLNLGALKGQEKITKEIVEKNWETLKGQEKIIQEIVKKATMLIEDKKLREKMSKAARKEIELGRFSIKERNKKLKRIYEEALK